jgi:hypothetical protein
MKSNERSSDIRAWTGWSISSRPDHRKRIMKITFRNVVLHIATIGGQSDTALHNV